MSGILTHSVKVFWTDGLRRPSGGYPGIAWHKVETFLQSPKNVLEKIAAIQQLAHTLVTPGDDSHGTAQNCFFGWNHGIVARCCTYGIVARLFCLSSPISARCHCHDLPRGYLTSMWVGRVFKAHSSFTTGRRIVDVPCNWKSQSIEMRTFKVS